VFDRHRRATNAAHIPGEGIGLASVRQICRSRGWVRRGPQCRGPGQHVHDPHAAVVRREPDSQTTSLARCDTLGEVAQENEGSHLRRRVARPAVLAACRSGIVQRARLRAMTASSTVARLDRRKRRRHPSRARRDVHVFRGTYGDAKSAKPRQPPRARGLSERDPPHPSPGISHHPSATPQPTPTQTSTKLHNLLLSFDKSLGGI
jgi:hypothetical protein